jgi:hypothetical protein
MKPDHPHLFQFMQTRADEYGRGVPPIRSMKHDNVHLSHDAWPLRLDEARPLLCLKEFSGSWAASRLRLRSSLSQAQSVHSKRVDSGRPEPRPVEPSFRDDWDAESDAARPIRTNTIARWNRARVVGSTQTDRRAAPSPSADADSVPARCARRIRGRR